MKGYRLFLPAKYVAELSTAKTAKEETINTIKTVGKYVVNAVTGKAKAKENADSQAGKFFFCY